MQKARSIFWRVMKVMPVVGFIFVLAAAPTVVKRKGPCLGVLAIALDLLPVICLIKAGVEIFAGDLIPNRIESESDQALPSVKLAA